jgi:small subunit ribosomal protein S14
MAKKSKIARNNYRIQEVAKKLNKRTELKDKIMDKNISLEERFNYQIQLNKLPWNASKKRIRNRCNISGRPRGYFEYFGLCRNKLRELAAEGLIAGLRKSSW